MVVGFDRLELVLRVEEAERFIWDGVGSCSDRQTRLCDVDYRSRPVS